MRNIEAKKCFFPPNHDNFADLCFQKRGVGVMLSRDRYDNDPPPTCAYTTFLEKHLSALRRYVTLFLKKLPQFLRFAFFF